eukprot:5925233-Alexandrium_andersonii.AAC.1
MSASLVGSEMCIRDRHRAHRAPPAARALAKLAVPESEHHASSAYHEAADVEPQDGVISGELDAAQARH